MPLAPGLRLGPYEVVAPAGTGGMGEVYRARDTRLNRDVALKVLPAALAGDPGRIARFQREAQILATLAHPGIAGIFGVEQSGSMQALVLEFVEGPTLAEQIEAGRLPYADALTIARQIAEALEAAHEQGVVHRDLKPANIKLRPDGVVKILDFGLAKALDAGGSGIDLTDALTVTSPALTVQGVILGTAAYMSPEQARGRAVDKRADNWAFGCVLFEMLTGSRPFRGDTVTDTLAAVVRSEPEWTILPRETSPAVRYLLKRCLDKDVKSRLRDIGEARIALESALDGTEDLAFAGAPGRSVSRRAILAIAIGPAIVAAAAASVAVWQLTHPPPPGMTRLSIVPPDDAPLVGDAIAVTPDGTQVVYVSGNGTQMSVRSLDQVAPRHLTNLGSPAYPFVSPDGRSIGYFDGLSALKVVPITGGPPTTICGLRGAAGRGGTWTRDGFIIFATDDPATGLWRVSERGGTPELITKPVTGEGDHLWPQALPDGTAVLVTVMGGRDRTYPVRIGVVDLRARTLTPLVAGAGARFVSSGHLLYGAAGALRAIAFDPQRRETRGAAVPIVEDVAGASAMTLSTAGLVGLAVSGDGSLFYVPSRPAGGRRLVWVDREGREEVLPVPPRVYVAPRVSRTGDKIAIDARDTAGTGADIWVWDVARRTLSRTSFGTSVYPVWTPDGRLVHTTFEQQVGHLFLRVPDGSTRAERLADGPSSRYPASVSPDGSRLLFREEGGDTGVDIGMLYLKGDRRVEPLLKTPANELNPEISPDGRWVAYESNQSGENEIYVRPFPDVNAGLWQVSTTGGRQPAWNRSGHELFYRAADGTVMSVPVVVKPRFAPGQASAVISGAYLHSGPYRSYDVSPDGKRFLMIKSQEEGSRRASDGTIVVVRHWLDELRAQLQSAAVR